MRLLQQVEHSGPRWPHSARGVGYVGDDIVGTVLGVAVTRVVVFPDQTNPK